MKPQRPLNSNYPTNPSAKIASIPHANVSPGLQSDAQVNEASSVHPRNGAPKRIVEAAPVPGQRSRIAPSHPFRHGAPAPLDDEPLEKFSKTYEQEIPVHPNMTSTPVPDDARRGKHEPEMASKVLNEAANLGRSGKA
jgi:hypothetical protein